MTKGEKLALFLGMLSGDGCLSIAHNGEGYRNYPIDFCNTEKDKVEMFAQLFKELFSKTGVIHSYKRAEDRKEIWSFRKHSVEIAEYLKSLGFPEGVKRDSLRVLSIIENGTERERLAFIYGVAITDGSIKPRRGVMFHSGSKLFLEDLSRLFVGLNMPPKIVKKYSQGNGRFFSYQLYLNKQEKEVVLQPGWHNGTASVLS